MKQMSIIYCNGINAPDSGRRIVRSEREEAILRKAHGQNASYIKATSTDTVNFIKDEVAKGRQKWAQLTVQVDDIPLAFWLPAELEIYCKVFAMVPFPTARTLVNKSPEASEMNRHWLSRLPKNAKSKKYRERFLKYVASHPPALMEFYEFYGKLV